MSEMTQEEIVAAHLRNNGMASNPEDLIRNINMILRSGGDIVREGNCLLVFKKFRDGVLIYMINGGNATGYIRAFRKFMSMFEKIGITKGYMRVADTASAQQIARTVGLGNVSFEPMSGAKTDPYLMAMEL